MSRYTELKSMGTQFLEITGAPVEEFEKYLPHFTAAYHELYPSENTDADQHHEPQNSDNLLAHADDFVHLP